MFKSISLKREYEQQDKRYSLTIIDSMFTKEFPFAELPTNTVSYIIKAYEQENLPVIPNLYLYLLSTHIINSNTFKTIRSDVAYYTDCGYFTKYKDCLLNYIDKQEFIHRHYND